MRKLKLICPLALTCFLPLMSLAVSGCASNNNTSSNLKLTSDAVVNLKPGSLETAFSFEFTGEEKSNIDKEKITITPEIVSGDKDLLDIAVKKTFDENYKFDISCKIDKALPIDTTFKFNVKFVFYDSYHSKDVDAFCNNLQINYKVPSSTGTIKFVDGQDRIKTISSSGENKATFKFETEGIEMKSITATVSLIDGSYEDNIGLYSEGRPDDWKETVVPLEEDDKTYNVSIKFKNTSGLETGYQRKINKIKFEFNDYRTYIVDLGEQGMGIKWQ